MKTLTLLLSFLIILSCGYGKTNNKTTSKIIQNKIKVIINAKVLENDVFEVYYYESGQETFHPLDFVSSLTAIAETLSIAPFKSLMFVLSILSLF